jgi:hypothetical protein
MIMKVTEVTVVAKYSLDTGHGWKAIEVGAIATLTNSDETLETAQQELYARLSHQLKVLWTNGSGKPALSEAKGLTQEQATPKEHWCSEHNQEWKLRNGPHGGFRSHQITGSRPTQWCNQPRT